MKQCWALLLLGLLACSDGTPSSSSGSAPAPSPAGAGPLYDPSHPNASLVAPSEFRVKFTTSKGDFTVIAFRDWAPRGVDRFYSLVKAGFFDECRFFRVVPDFVVQWGIPADPKVGRVWKPAKIMDDPVKQTNARGMMTFATSGANTRTTQIFVNTKDNTGLDGQGFAPFAKVIDGLSVVDAFTAEYGDAPKQGRLEGEGNDYAKKEFPNLDFVKTARVLE